MATAKPSAAELVADSRSASDSSRESHEAGNPEASDEKRERWLVFPRGELFEPLLADMRWPRFSAEYQWRLATDEFDRVGAVSFGESFSFGRSPQYDWGEWEFGLQAMVDAIFDMTGDSFDLSNEDYFVGLTASVLMKGVTTQLRVYHESSHLGDEYLIEHGGGRDSVSFEVIDLLASYEFAPWGRVVGGIGVLVNSNPSYDPMTTQLNVELTSPKTFVSGYVTPIFGVDLQLRQENDWIPEVNVLGGLRVAEPGEKVRRIEIVAHYYHGRSPDGQFFEQTIDLIGLGMRLGF